MNHDEILAFREMRDALMDCRFQMAAINVEFGEHIKQTRPSLLKSFNQARINANRILEPLLLPKPGCAKDTDSDGNCPAHPKGCP